MRQEQTITADRLLQARSTVLAADTLTGTPPPPPPGPPSPVRLRDPACAWQMHALQRSCAVITSMIRDLKRERSEILNCSGDGLSKTQTAQLTVLDRRLVASEVELREVRMEAINAEAAKASALRPLERAEHSRQARNQPATKKLLAAVGPTRPRPAQSLLKRNTDNKQRLHLHAF